MIARPKISIDDFFVISDLENNYTTGLFSVDVNVRNFKDFSSGNNKLVISLLDENQKKIASKDFQIKDIPANSSKTFSFSKKINNPKKWSAEYPNLYAVEFQLLDDTGKSLEWAGCKTGFRKVEIKNTQLLINGQPIMVTLPLI